MRLLLGLAALVVGAHAVNGVTSDRGAKEVKNIAIIGKFNEQTFLKIHVGLMHRGKLFVYRAKRRVSRRR